jgi:hypothetical protein
VAGGGVAGVVVAVLWSSKLAYLWGSHCHLDAALRQDRHP